MHITEEQKARIMRILVNAVIVMLGAAVTALLQFIAQFDFGSATPFVAGMISIAVKAVQTWAEPAQDIYRLR